MYRILVVSDSHGKTEYIKKQITTIEKFDLIIHLGDYLRDGLSLENTFPQYEFEIVKGNCEAHTTYGETEKLLDVCGKKIFITHGDRYGVKMGYDRIIYKGFELEADCVLFGHTHMATKFKENGILFLNPGAAKDNSCGIIEIEDEKIEGCVLEGTW